MNSKPKLNGLANLVINPMKLLMDTSNRGTYEFSVCRVAQGYYR